MKYLLSSLTIDNTCFQAFQPGEKYCPFFKKKGDLLLKSADQKSTSILMICFSKKTKCKNDTYRKKHEKEKTSKTLQLAESRGITQYRAYHFRIAQIPDNGLMVQTKPKKDKAKVGRRAPPHARKGQSRPCPAG